MRLREPGREPGARLQVALSPFHHPLQVVDEGRIRGPRRQLVRRHVPQQRYRVVLGCLPGVRIDAPKDILRARIPGPPQVIGQVAQPAEFVRNCRTHGDDVVRLHVRHGWCPIPKSRRLSMAA